MNEDGGELSLGRVALERELLNQRQMDHCRQELTRRRQADGATTLGDLMVELGYISDGQLVRLRATEQRRRCRVPGYEVRATLGAGAVGTVYRARQVAMEREVALKVLHPHLASEPAVVARYIAEARAVARMNHPHIVQGIDVGQAGDVHYFAMEYLSGGTLRRLLKENGPLDEEPARILLYQAAWALEHAAARDLVHRDIKPENLMLDADGCLKVTDFGLALAGTEAETAEGKGKRVVRGTPHYISPEQVTDPASLDHRSDLYCLGATFYHLLSGRPPFSGGSNKDIVLARLKREPAPLSARRPDLSEEMADLVHKMLARDIDKRPASAKQVKEMLVEAGLDPMEAGDRTGAGSTRVLRKGDSTRSRRTSRRASVRRSPPPAKPKPEESGLFSRGRSWLWLGALFLALAMATGVGILLYKLFG